MDKKNLEKSLDPYERKMLKLFEDRGKMKFGQIIMRLGLSANHGQRVLNSLMDKKLVAHTNESKYYTPED